LRCGREAEPAVPHASGTPGVSVALLSSRRWVESRPFHDAKCVFGDFNSWGWCLLAFGVLQFFAAVAIWRGASVCVKLGVRYPTSCGLAVLLDALARPGTRLIPSRDPG
jgi:hypothetical protein